MTVELLFDFILNVIYKYIRFFKILYKKSFKFVPGKNKQLNFNFLAFYVIANKNWPYFREIKLQKKYIKVL